MRLLFIAFPHSVHAARWISQLVDSGHELHLFPSIEGDLHQQFRSMRGLVVHDRRGSWWDRMAACVSRLPLPAHWPGMTRLRGWLQACVCHWERPARLERAINRINPDLVHALELQHAGYLAADVCERMGRSQPLAVTNWGSDIYLFGRLDAHADRIRHLLAMSDYYICECKRDVQLAKVFGFTGEVLGVVPGGGGFDTSRMQSLSAPGSCSQRRVIVVKGYQHWAGRGLVALQSLRYCADALDGYVVKLHSAGGEDVRIAAELVAQDTGLSIEIMPFLWHDEMAALYGEARVAVALSISDAASHSLLEALVMGAFPIQSNTACATEWIEDGRDAILVEPEDPREVAEAIRRAVTDDALVDAAAERNMRVARERLDESVIRPQVVEMYRRVAADVAREQGDRVAR